MATVYLNSYYKIVPHSQFTNLYFSLSHMTVSASLCLLFSTYVLSVECRKTTIVNKIKHCFICLRILFFLFFDLSVHVSCPFFFLWIFDLWLIHKVWILHLLLFVLSIAFFSRVCYLSFNFIHVISLAHPESFHCYVTKLIDSFFYGLGVWRSVCEGIPHSQIIYTILF